MALIDDLRAKRAELADELAALETGQLHIGNPWEGRTEARMHDIRRKLAECELQIEKHSG